MTPLLSSKQLAETLQISEEQVRRLTREGSLPHHRIGGVFRYDLETVKAATERDSKGGAKLKSTMHFVPAAPQLKGLVIDDESGEIHLADLVWCRITIYEDDDDSVGMMFVSANGALWENAVDTSTDTVLGWGQPHSPRVSLSEWASERGLKVEGRQ